MAYLGRFGVVGPSLPQHLEHGVVTSKTGRHAGYLKAADVDIIARMRPPLPRLGAALNYGNL
jgi:hypothetical protein